ncbi:calcium uptake protein 3, mitochondrial-like [Oscarella lobularis]|uniref:calcium uptake protein 3, mitochondrial-like n=1 Tax=Oscarella lobularis TaxID=121494 RepID=UPI0033140D81
MRRSFHFVRAIRGAARRSFASQTRGNRSKILLGVGAGSLAAAGLAIGCNRRWTTASCLPRVYADSPDSEKEAKVSGGSRRRRFLQFASCQYNGEPYMTPQDFLESLSFSEPTARIGRRKVDEKEMDRYLRKVPPVSKNSRTFFRDLWKDGLVSYPEYLFLTTLLTKPKRQFEIAFLMFDRDGSGTIERKEFLAIERVVSKQQEGKEPFCTTSLLVHLFGRNGERLLNLESFSRFMDNLQEEVLDIEFHEVSRGLPVISETAFAHLLLHDSNLDHSEIDDYLQRLEQRSEMGDGITFPQFLDFAQFLNELEDFAVAVRMFTLAGQPVTQDEFQRAVKSSIGKRLDPKLVQVVFHIFDVDGDGKLSYAEFINVMKDRKNRGFKSRDAPKGWEGFKHCMRQKMMK